MCTWLEQYRVEQMVRTVQGGTIIQSSLLSDEDVDRSLVSFFGSQCTTPHATQHQFRVRQKSFLTYS